VNLFNAIFNEQSASSVAIVYENARITYADLQEQTLKIAAVLDQLGIAPGERVAILLNDSPEFIASFIAICSSKAIAVPINMGLQLEEQRAILKDCTARLAIVEANMCSSLQTGVHEGLQELKQVAVVSRDEHFVVPQSVGPEILNLQQLLREGRAAPPEGFAESDENEAAFILYTSGSTGEPKGAIHCQSDIFYTNETFCNEVLGLRSGDRVFSSSRLPFAYGLGNSFTFPLLNGVTTILCREKPTPEVIARIFRENRPTLFFGVPVIYNLLLDHHRHGNELDCSSLHLCISAGEALPAQLGEEWERTFGVEVLDGIGSTEMLHMFMSNHSGDVRYGSSGKLLNGYDARLLDQEGNPTSDGEVGNLWVRGKSAARGYWKKAEATNRTFVDGWVRTGDLYMRNADGFWFHKGRSDDCFKSSGQWVSPVEVEGAVLRHQSVSRAAVVEDFDKDGLPCACAFVVCNDNAVNLEQVEQELRALLKESLPRFKQPRRYVFVDDLPYTATGKIQRFKLREQLRIQTAASHR
jgi:benzoate-CoA ligase family protein